MNTTVLLMAGGKSERMRAQGGAEHKALRAVGGRTLLERNFSAACEAGFADIVVAISEREKDLERYARDVLGAMAVAAGVHLEILREALPLGNIGAVGLLAERADDILVVYVDNLTTLDLSALVNRHRAGAYALTIATHEEVLTDPYGDLELAGDEVVAYREKPSRRVWISSGTCVVTARAARLVPPGLAFGASDLFGLLRSRGERIGAFRHRSLWVDVNDLPALARAERLLA